ncbi:MAG: carboxylating nicotinate-nucleotide diphosphorylase [Candidatus Acetothermia bacterium]|jgi:nicotinate-nucleotide pyrophosphorylase (carboxylating)|nr:carboxylating nicotinate-nucleotide diphosphorylase [Candidatus Acetothermia bacterium]MDH7506018.1 carboxylating nicotinate-nucleotide diphosphorylase [Candidatus Acetothermia bacterium]
MEPQSLLEAAANLIEQALAEDLGRRGDVTTAAIVPEEAQGEGVILAKAKGVLAGLPLAGEVFRRVDPEIRFIPQAQDGEPVAPRAIVAQVSGPLRGILTAERAALNFLCRLSGIATLTSRYVDAVAPYHAVILDTRKTTPGWRALEKYAVRCGGGQNHRMGLYDMVLIKDNHIAAAGSITEAVRRARAALAPSPQPSPSKGEGMGGGIEVEVRTLEELEEALALGVDRILLDNMDLPTLKEAVALAKGRAKLEASGGITLENVAAVAATGVDYISVGALTHSAPALDLSLELIR